MDLGRLRKAVVELVTGNLISAALNFLTVLMVARHLGVERYGLLALVTSYGLIANRLLAFQSTKTFIQRSSSVQGASEEYADLRKLALFLDQGSAFFGFIVGVSFVPIFVNLLSIGSELIPALFAAASTTLFAGIGLSQGVLRSEGKFSLIAKQAAAISTVKMIGAFIIIENDGGLIDLSIWTSFMVISSHVSLQLVAKVACPQLISYRSILGVRRSDFFGKTELLKDFFYTNTDMCVRAIRDLDIIILTAVSGPSSSGVFRLVKQILALPQIGFDQISVAAYPQLSKAVAEADFNGIKNLLRTNFLVSSAASLGIVLGFAIFGRTLIEITVGEDFMAAYVVGILSLVGLGVYSVGQLGGTCLQAFGRFRRFTFMQLGVVAIYFLTIVTLGPTFGAMAGAVGLVALYGTWIGITNYSVLSLLK